MSAVPELAANFFNTLSIVCAGRNSVHTWWTGIVGCLLFAWVFFGAKLYADTTLQGFFVATSLLGWWQWRAGTARPELPIRRSTPRALAWLALAGVLVTCAYGLLLHRFTDAYAPFVDSAILAFSVLGQLLMMRRRLETWWCWLLVNLLAVPVYWLRGLNLTALLYAGYFVHAGWSLRYWSRQVPAA